MALVNCPECNAAISDSAGRCPACGAVQRHHPLLIAFALVALIAAAIAVFNFDQGWRG